jgi:hypothetical protein
MARRAGPGGLHARLGERIAAALLRDYDPGATAQAVGLSVASESVVACPDGVEPELRRHALVTRLRCEDLVYRHAELGVECATLTFQRVVERTLRFRGYLARIGTAWFRHERDQQRSDEEHGKDEPARSG